MNSFSSFSFWTRFPNWAGFSYTKLRGELISMLLRNKNNQQKMILSNTSTICEMKKICIKQLWTYYSMINNKYQAIYGERLQEFPRITMLRNLRKMVINEIHQNSSEKSELISTWQMRRIKGSTFTWRLLSLLDITVDYDAQI